MGKVDRKDKGNKRLPAFLESIFSKFQTIKIKIVALVLLSVVAAVAVTMVVLIEYSKTLVVDSAYGKMLNVVSSYGSMIDKTEGGKALTSEEYAEMLKDVSLEGISSANCFLVDKNGIVKYYPDAERIGKPNKNKVITTVVGNINKGKTPENLCTEYEEDGVQKYASFFITSAKSIVVMEARADELMSPIKVLTRRAILIAIIVLVVALVLTFVVVRGITNPILQLIQIINNTAKLRLTFPESLNKLCKRQDETGEISRAVRTMSVSLKDVVTRIDDANKSIENDMQNLEKSSNSVNVFCTDNSATAKKLVASTQKAAQMTEDLNNEMRMMKDKSEDIRQVALDNSDQAVEISGRAQQMQATTIETMNRTRETYQEIKTKADIAVEGLSAVSRINDLTEAISEISDQTSLLSLNASIEAARAGDAGRGFAVVATEISNLANRSLETVGDINKIISDVNKAVKNISKAMEETSAFIETNVMADFDEYNKIGEQYMKDAQSFKAGMDNISEVLGNLNDSISSVSDGLENIQDTIKDTTVSVENIAEKNSEVVFATTDNYELTNSTVARVDDLKLIVDSFEI